MWTLLPGWAALCLRSQWICRWRSSADMALPNAGTAFIHALSSSSTGALAREGVGEDRPSSETAASTASAHAAKSLAPPPNDRPRPHPPSRSAGNILPSGFARGAGTDSPGRRRLRHLEVPELNSIQFTPSLNAPSRSRVPPHPAATTGAKHAPPCHQGGTPPPPRPRPRAPRPLRPACPRPHTRHDVLGATGIR